MGENKAEDVVGGLVTRRRMPVALAGRMNLLLVSLPCT